MIETWDSKDTCSSILVLQMVPQHLGKCPTTHQSSFTNPFTVSVVCYPNHTFKPQTSFSFCLSQTQLSPYHCMLSVVPSLYCLLFSLCYCSDRRYKPWHLKTSVLTADLRIRLFCILLVDTLLNTSYLQSCVLSLFHSCCTDETVSWS